MPLAPPGAPRPPMLQSSLPTEKEPVKAEPLGPRYLDDQTWLIERTEDEGSYLIRFVPEYATEPSFNLGFSNELKVAPDLPIRLLEPSLYRIEILTETIHGDYIVHIKPQGLLATEGTAYYVGVGENNTVALKLVEMKPGVVPPAWFVTPRGWVE
ncbi:peptidase inhibitor clitocypin domain-containing protein [Ceratobasidium sp. AG-Ba]|nr:peptidase inhibitor clitocypin domain-containing protein [Ceratobasidium sp. AG-Ba]